MFIEDLANYVIFWHYERNLFISNNRLQKILFLIQCESLKSTLEPTFTEDFIMWDYGPIIPEIYFKYSSAYEERSLPFETPIDIKRDVKVIANHVLERVEGVKTRYLVQDILKAFGKFTVKRDKVIPLWMIEIISEKF